MAGALQGRRRGPLLFVLLLLVVAHGAIGQYCNLRSCNGRQHTMCSYGPGGRAGCRENTLTATDRNTILNTHNRLRREIRDGKHAGLGLPPAQEMPDLSWDEELERIAQRWANQCVQGHDQCRDKQNGVSVGQNAAWSFGRARSLAESIQDWFDEIKVFAGSSLRFVFSSATGHFTQIIWAKTTTVGCAVAITTSLVVTSTGRMRKRVA